MEEIDQIIRNKLKNRTLATSDSAWDRMNEKLDTSDQKSSKKLIWYIGYAASILLLVSLYFISSKNQIKSPILTEPILVNGPSVEPLPSVPILEEKPSIKEVLVTNSPAQQKFESLPKSIVKEKGHLKQHEKTSNVGVNQNNRIALVKKEKNKTLPVDIELKKKEKPNLFHQNSNSRIKVNADALLYAVTHNAKDVNEYYAKYNIQRDDALRSVKAQLGAANISMNAEAILAEVERTIEEDDFENNFLKFLRKRVSDITTALASRNN